MISNVLFLKSKKDFSEKEKRQIKKTIKNTTNHAAKILNLKSTSSINFTVYSFDKKHVGGFTQAEDWIHITIPSKKFPDNELKGTIYHEMHHIARGYTGYSKRKVSLLETLFSEGLATVFEKEQVLKRVPKYSKYTNDFIKKWLPKIRKENLNSTNFSHDEWFFGKKGKPFQFGYKIGTYLIKQIKKNHPELTAGKLVKTNVKLLLKLSKVKL